MKNPILQSRCTVMHASRCNAFTTLFLDLINDLLNVKIRLNYNR